MSPALSFSIETCSEDDEHHAESTYQKGVKYLCDNNNLMTKVPNKYILPCSDRPDFAETDFDDETTKTNNLNLPVIDFAELQGPNRSHVLKTLAKACEEYGFFQLINHGISRDIIHSMIDAARRFFELPHEERAKYMSSDMYSPVRYGTSFNQSKDKVFCWRDFLKLSCPATLPDALAFWPSSPIDFRQATVSYSNETKCLYMMIVEAILETLGLLDQGMEKLEDDLIKNNMKEFEDGSQMMVLNCYPSCPEPDLTLGMPPHSDYGLLTLLLQDEVKGLQIQHRGRWLTVEPIPNSFVVNVGDHLEIFSNGKYKSVLHRVLVNSLSSRISIASLHSLPLNCTVRPSPKLINEANPKRYKDTDFATFLEYVSSREPKRKNFIESRKLI